MTNPLKILQENQPKGFLAATGFYIAIAATMFGAGWLGWTMASVFIK